MTMRYRLIISCGIICCLFSSTFLIHFELVTLGVPPIKIKSQRLYRCLRSGERNDCETAVQIGEASLVGKRPDRRLGAYEGQVRVDQVLEDFFDGVDIGNWTATLPPRPAKDCGYVTLSVMLNRMNWKPFSTFNGIEVEKKREVYSIMLGLLGEYLSLEPPSSIDYFNMPKPAPDCANPRNKGVFTGAKLERPRRIVDLVLAGYDMDVVEARLFENYHSVDLFIVFESLRTQQGVKKPLVFAQSRGRFKAFEDKILYLVGDDADELPIAEAFAKGGPRSWVLEEAMRDTPIKKMRRLPEHILYPDQSHDTWVIMSDSDEILTAQAVVNAKHCELKKSTSRIVVPTTHFKKTLDWLMMEDRCEILTGPKELHPYHVTTVMLVKAKDLLKDGGFKRRGRLCNAKMYPTLPIGSLVHVSENVDVAASLWKLGGQIERKLALPPVLIQAGLRGQISPGLLVATMVKPWCWSAMPIRARSNFTQESKEWIPNLTLPALHPGRICTLVPESSGHPLLGFTALPNWVDECDRGVRKQRSLRRLKDWVAKEAHPPN